MQLGIEPGDEVDVERRGTEAVIRRHRVSRRRATRADHRFAGPAGRLFLVAAPRSSRRSAARSAQLEERKRSEPRVAIVLDTWALLALLNDEPAADRVEQAWLDEKPVMCSVNLGEALYVLIRVHGEGAARRALDGGARRAQRYGSRLGPRCRTPRVEGRWRSFLRRLLRAGDGSPRRGAALDRRPGADRVRRFGRGNRSTSDLRQPEPADLPAAWSSPSGGCRSGRRRCRWRAGRRRSSPSSRRRGTRRPGRGRRC